MPNPFPEKFFDPNDKFAKKILKLIETEEYDDC